MLIKLIKRNSFYFLLNSCKMCTYIEGKIPYPRGELNLNLTLLGGQSFRWQKTTSTETIDTKWRGVAFDCFWELSQAQTELSYKVFCSKNKDNSEDFYREALEKYLRLDFDLNANCEKWKSAHKHFAETGDSLKAVRVLDQEPLETIISFICSQNNHIKRISTMVQWLCRNYGQKICSYEGEDYFTFPSLNSLYSHQSELESSLRAAKFGYRAKFIAGSVRKIQEFGGTDWFNKLKTLPYKDARVELVTLPGIGFKVADCICLMALNHLESVPIDTHIYKIAQSAYLPQLKGVKSVTPKIYEEVADHFRQIYGQYAGWAQAVLFCSGLQMFQESKESRLPPKRKKKN